MAAKTESFRGINSWLEDELYQQYLHDRSLVDPSWKEVFQEGGAEAAEAPPLPREAAAQAVVHPPAVAPGTPEPSPAPPIEPAAFQAGPAEKLIPLRGAAARIAGNMTASLSVPTATSQRTVPVKVIDENRRIINVHRSLKGQGKLSYTHLIGWAIVQALQDFPRLNSAYIETNEGPFCLLRTEVNLGLAVDVPDKDGSRSLLVPNIKDAGRMNFQEFLTAYEDLVSRARSGKLSVADFGGTTISLTNPGTVGTIASMPRLMKGQGAILATGAIDYPPGFQGMAEESRAMIGISKVMTMTCTYDHRVIQGAESGMFLGRIHELLQGANRFYDQIFADLKMPHNPLTWEQDRPALAQAAGSGRSAEIAKEAAVLQLINAYRVRGHLIADLNPLGTEPKYHPELAPGTYGLTIWDLDREFLTGTLGSAAGDGAPKPVATLREILETLRQTYSGRIGCEFMHIQHPEQKRWLQERMEPTANNWPLDAATRTRILERLIAAEEFEHFLHARFVGQKRFSLEGCETTIAALDALLDQAADNGVHEVVIGMAHRGRLNVLANTVGKPLTQILSEFEGDPDPASIQGSGDMKYHLGAAGIHTSPAGRELVVSVAPNPSHLEAVDPVVEGIVRPKQDRLGDTARERVIPVLLHGDAAFAGQGVVAETINLSQLSGYRTGGTIHLVVNNQIGFTTLPYEGRSTAYCTDVARMVQAPVFHVNGDDPEAAVRAIEIAYDYRQRFKKDVVVDLIGYRRHGHNEADDPSYTQPVMYKKIRSHPSVAALFSEKILREGVLTLRDIERVVKRITARFEEAYEAAQKRAERFEVPDLGALDLAEIGTYSPETAISKETLEQIIEGLTRFPAGFHLHPKLNTFIARRRQIPETGGSVDWALGEALAFGSLVLEGTPVRLSGQDSARGTFSQRHLAFTDYEDGHEYIPMQHLAEGQARFNVHDSALSEYAVLGYEFGYSLGDPLALVMWEAQFGDFANGAQIMIDQFISCAEQKWGQPSGLVLLLPHGYEGQGPEHSSARIERFLVLCAEGNMQVANCKTPAQYFHLLRRQMHGGPDRRGVRKPLVIFTPKSLLRHPHAVSPIEEFTSGGFREVLGDPVVREAGRVARVLLCSGKIHYELLAAREERHAQHVAIVRVEQLYPFPESQLQDILYRYPVTAEVFWVQEEPQNMGPWRFMREWIQPLLDAGRRTLEYVGRNRSASPAPGSFKRHQQEQAAIVEEAFAVREGGKSAKVRPMARRKG